ncbi:MAG: SDR family oxidoreductase [Maritimibacter sp.]|nr:SDR family oxidoreductase [Maritimibacter sp.]
MTRYLVTGAAGQLGRLVLADLISKVPAVDIVALVRRPDAAADLAKLGVETRIASYEDPAALAAAFAGIDRLLLISSSEVGQRAPQHQNVIDAAKAAGVGFIAYTSLLKAGSSPLQLAAEHRATEAALAASGIPHALLRNGWYSENLLGNVVGDIALGQRFGAAGTGRFALAPRRDYAAAAAAVLTGAGHEGKTYELAGDTGLTQAEIAALFTEASGKPVAYVDLPEPAFRDALVGVGLPEGFAAILADSDARAAEGWLDAPGNDLSRLIGRPTEPFATTLAAAL